MKELTFDIDGLDETQLAAYETGILDALQALGVDWEYDETDPNLKQFKIVLSDYEPDPLS